MKRALILLSALALCAGCLNTKATYTAPGLGTVTLERTALGINIEGLELALTLPCGGAGATPNSTPDATMCPIVTFKEQKVDATTATAQALGSIGTVLGKIAETQARTATMQQQLQAVQAERALSR